MLWTSEGKLLGSSLQTSGKLQKNIQLSINDIKILGGLHSTYLVPNLIRHKTLYSK